MRVPVAKHNRHSAKCLNGNFLKFRSRLQARRGTRPQHAEGRNSRHFSFDQNGRQAVLDALLELSLGQASSATGLGDLLPDDP